MTTSIYGDLHVVLHLDMTGREDGAPGWYITEHHNEGYSSVLGEAPVKRWITPEQATRITQVIADEIMTPQLIRAVDQANVYARERVVQLKAAADAAAARAARLAAEVERWGQS